MPVTLALPNKDEVAHLLFDYKDHDIEGRPFPGGFDVRVTDPEGREYRIGSVEEATEVRGAGVDWVDSPDDERFYIGATVVNRRSGNVYFVRAIISGRLALAYHGKPYIRNADRANWRVVEVL